MVTAKQLNKGNFGWHGQTVLGRGAALRMECVLHRVTQSDDSRRRAVV